jgi:hypothetical protein
MAADMNSATNPANVSADHAEREPRGFGEHARGLAGEYAHEQGWGLNEPERTHQPDTPQDTDGGNDYEYGARDFGETPVNTATQSDNPEPTQNAAPAHTKQNP